MLPLHTHAKVDGALSDSVLKVLRADEALRTELPRQDILIDLRREEAGFDDRALLEVGFAGKVVATLGDETKLPTIHSLRDDRVVSSGDVIRVRRGGQLSVLYRRHANANSLFVTERCNSLCLMCSQPPRPDDDSWRIAEQMKLIALIDRDLPVLGITGGEPALLGGALHDIIAAVQKTLPQTELHVLTNGRRFADESFVDQFHLARTWTTWAVPLYADTAASHDYVVQARGAFDEAVNGIYNLAERGHRIEIRFVLHAQTVPRLSQFAEFVWRTLPFVNHVAFMGMEPMGYAKVNRDLLWIDPLDYAQSLEEAAWYLEDRGIPTSLYNLPFCVLSKSAWPLARQSISDWKNVFAPECAECQMRDRCSGFFQSAGFEWRSRGISPVPNGDAA